MQLGSADIKPMKKRRNVKKNMAYIAEAEADKVKQRRVTEAYFSPDKNLG